MGDALTDGYMPDDAISGHAPACAAKPSSGNHATRKQATNLVQNFMD
jgi:hypothetical protein